MYPNRTSDIEFHKNNALGYWTKKEYDLSRISFFKFVESVRQQNKNTNGKLDAELKEAQSLYSQFVKEDPLYIKLCQNILPFISNNPGILQTDLYKAFPSISRENLSYVLYFAAEHGKIKREKKGRTYQLSFP